MEWEFGVHSHKSHIGRLLKELDWTPQQPIRRDEDAIRRRLEDVWPELRRRAPRERRALVCEVEHSSVACGGSRVGCTRSPPRSGRPPSGTSFGRSRPMSAGSG
ncbi:winged helix-turn-helix domain-containing protein [Singulisphaera sp. PoT]|uniref:winged helix-turn-helix domain-containing protein n=1 Tax=Singulisphaera sp. PoT TaxID=3411797 RepID=UPI003BF54CB8